MDGFTIRCGGHNYITLEWTGKFIFCLDNDLLYAEEMIHKIEKRTKMNFQDIPIKGSKDDFQGLIFLMAVGNVIFGAIFQVRKKLKDI